MARADPAPPPRHFDTWLLLSFVVLTLIWGSTWLVIKTQLGTVPPAWSVTYRFIIGGGVLLLWCVAARRSFALGRKGHGFALVIGLLQFALNFNFVYHAEFHVTSGLVALVFAMLVVANAGLAALILKQPITARFAIGSVIGIAGVALLVGPDVAQASQVGLGLALAVAGMLAASLSNVLQATRLARRLPAEATLALSMLYGAALNAGYALVTAGPPVVDPRPEYWLGLAYLSLIASVGAFLIYFAMIRRVGAPVAGYVSVLVPVVAMSLSTVFESYRWTPLAVGGVLLTLAGMVVALRSRD